MNTFNTTRLCEAAGWAEKNFRNALERKDHMPRLGKQGGRYEFTVEDVADAAIMRHLVQLGLPVKTASERARSFVDHFFKVIPGKSTPISLERLAKFGEGRFLQIFPRGKDDVDLSVQDHPELNPMPANARARWDFQWSPSVYWISLESVFGGAAKVLMGAESNK